MRVPLHIYCWFYWCTKWIIIGPTSDQSEPLLPHTKTVRMAVIINTAMERVVCVACVGFWREKFVYILPPLLLTLAWKCVSVMHFMTYVITNCHVCELGCRKVYKSWTKGRLTLDWLFSTLTENGCDRIVHKAVACTFNQF